MASSSGRVLRKANPKTIQDKFLVGYQGWFTCPGDGPPIAPGHHGWIHWFNKPIPDGGKPTIDAWPDVSDYSPSELYPAPGLSIDGKPALLFSSRNPKTVQRHFHLMAMHGVDGAFLQRFAGQCEVDGRTEGGNSDVMRWRDEVGDRVREAAEKEGRVFAIMYDVSGVPGDRIEKVIKVDWQHLLRDRCILDSPAYLHEDGRPVIALWGLGFSGRGHDPETVRRIVRYIRSVTPGGAYIMAGAPTHWQILRGDADPNPGFRDVWYNEFDAISPWTVGRYHNEEAADQFLVEKVKKDIKALKESTAGRKVDYIPVIFPGASGNNLSDGKWRFNDDARNGGKFFWRQLYNVRKEGVRIIYGAMWDEYDEATAILPIVQTKRQLPTPGKFLALDEDGYDLPPDWFMRISGFAGELLRGERMLHETFPVKELQDYWSSRPKFEEEVRPHAEAEASGSSAGPSAHSEGVAESFEQWIEKEKEEKDEVPPPPYTLEASEAEVVPEESDTRRVPSPVRRQEPTAPAVVQAQQPIQPLDASQPAQAGPYAVDESRNSADSRPTSGSSTLAFVAPPNRASSLIVGHQGFPNNSCATQASPSDPRVSLGSLNGGSSSSSPQQAPSVYPTTSSFQGGRTSSFRHEADVTSLSGRFSQQSLQSPSQSDHSNGALTAPQQAPPANQYADQQTSLSMLHSHPDESIPSQWPPPEWHVRPAHRPPSASGSPGPGAVNPAPRPQQAPFHTSSSPRPHTPGRHSHSPSPSPSATPGFRPLTPSTSLAPSASLAPFPGPSFSFPTPASSDAPYGFMPPVPNVPRPSAPGWAFENSSPFPQANYGRPNPSPPLPSASTRPPARISSLSQPSPTGGLNIEPSYFPQAPVDPLQRPGSSAYRPPQNDPYSPYANSSSQPAWPGYGYGYNNASPGGFAPPQPQYPSQHPMPGGSNYSLPPPPPPPRPTSAVNAQNSHMPMPQSGNTNDRLFGVASGAYSYALGAVDKVAGTSTRRQVEQGVDSITDTGRKLFSKFTK